MGVERGGDEAGVGAVEFGGGGGLCLVEWIFILLVLEAFY